MKIPQQHFDKASDRIYPPGPSERVFENPLKFSPNMTFVVTCSPRFQRLVTGLPSKRVLPSYKEIRLANHVLQAEMDKIQKIYPQLLKYFEMLGKMKTPNIPEIEIIPVAIPIVWGFMGIKPQKSPKFLSSPSQKYPQNSSGNFWG